MSSPAHGIVPCAYCGAGVRADAHHCRRCGLIVPTAPERQPVPVPRIGTPPSRGAEADPVLAAALRRLADRARTALRLTGALGAAVGLLVVLRRSGDRPRRGR